ncbi:MAG: CPBP family intramembrane metalloprotease [Chitinophagaceae bacterium]|nr:CPBP family intramembrane metalloprotease [Anaerolineae bacterium]
MITDVRTSKSPLIFFLWLFIISVPFWLIGALTERFLPKDLPINLPLSSLMTFNPMIVALILVFRESGTAGVKGLLKRSFDYRSIQQKIWYLPIFLLMPLIMVLEFGLLNLMGNSIPYPEFSILIVPVFFLIFFITALGEEVGWQGYAFDPLQNRWNALEVSIILGIVWAVWHIMPYIQTHNTPTWILWQCVTTVGLRVLIVWFYNNNGKSLFAAITFHAMINVSTFLFPNYGSYYNPFIASIIIAVAVATVVIVWGPKTLAQHRY